MYGIPYGAPPRLGFGIWNAHVLGAGFVPADVLALADEGAGEASALSAALPRPTHTPKAVIACGRDRASPRKSSPKITFNMRTLLLVNHRKYQCLARNLLDPEVATTPVLRPGLFRGWV
jgi:hypothetical protein